MPDCDYCEESFGSETAYLKHLESTHEGELGPIDKRRVGEAGDDDSSLADAAGPIALGAIVLFAGAIIAYLVFFAGSGSASDGPSNLGAVHGHGTINMTVTGDRVDFSRPEYQRPRENSYFHFERGNGRIWHVHGEGVTLQYAMNTLDIGVTGDSVTFGGTTYEDSDPEYDVEVTVGGEAVDPSEYVLTGSSRTPEARRTSSGSHVRVVVTRTN
jgi:hypothetical protein